jgi:hypothetical protein
MADALLRGMFTFNHQPRNGQTVTHTVVAIVLTNGTMAGEGIYHEERDYGMYRACHAAVMNGYYDAACGHAQQLSEVDEALIRRMAARLSKHRAELAAKEAAAAKRRYDELFNAAASAAVKQVA